MPADQKKKVNRKSNIPLFPAFAKLNIGHRNEINSIVSRHEPYADFTFVNLFTWSINDQTEVSILNGSLVVKFPDYISGLPTYSIIGDSGIDESIKQLMTLTNSLNLVPEVVIRNLSAPAKYII